MPDGVLNTFVLELRARGVAVRGLMQQIVRSDWGCEVTLTDIETGETHAISQKLGKASQSCSLDAAALADASQVMRRAQQNGTELAVFNRFSGLEAEGDGFAQEMLGLMSEGIPVLTVVPRRHLTAWQAFTGNLGSELPVSLAALHAWFDGLAVDADLRAVSGTTD